MSAVVCGKRSTSIFFQEDPLLLHTTPPPSSKRIRFCSPSPALRLSPPPPSTSPAKLESAPSVVSQSQSNLSHLRSLFPVMDQKFLERALEAAGNDLDSAIKSLSDLHLESAERSLGFAGSTSDDGIETNIQLSTEGSMNNVAGDAATENSPSARNLPTEGSEWVELFVREMMNASNVDDARARASRALEVLEKSIVARAGAEATQNFQKENMMLKEQLEVLVRENTILKRAVAIQHERQKEYDDRSQELQQLKQLVSQYQEQLRTLEVNNYALTLHLQQAQQSSSIPGRFHPDVF